MRIKDIMNKEPYILYEDDTLLEASKFMKQEKIRNLTVVDSSGKLVGLITLREIINAMSSNTQMGLVKDAMITQIKSVGPDTPLKGAIEIMLLNKFGCLPVTDSSRNLIAMVTEIDLLKTLYDLIELPDDFKSIEEQPTFARKLSNKFNACEINNTREKISSPFKNQL